MRKQFSSGNVVLLIILSLWLLSGCSAMKKITGGDDQKEEKLTRIDSVYYVQAGAFHNQDYAHERAKELSRKFTYRIEITEKENLNIIKLGPFDEKSKARECKNVLIKEGYGDAFINARMDSAVKQE